MTPWITARQASLSITNSRSLLKLMSIESVMLPAIPSSVVPFSSCPQSLPASGSSPMSQLFAWGGQSIGVSASASVLPMNTQDWAPLGWMVGSPCNMQNRRQPVEICCIMRGAQTQALWPRGVGLGGKWEGVSRGRGHMSAYGWLMLMYGRNRQNTVKQLSFN